VMIDEKTGKKAMMTSYTQTCTMWCVVKNIGCVEIHRCGDTKNRENSETKRHGKARRELAST